MEGSVSSSSCEAGIHTVIRTVVEKMRVLSVGGLFCRIERACADIVLVITGSGCGSVGPSCTIQTVLAVAGIMRESLHIGVGEV